MGLATLRPGFVHPWRSSFFIQFRYFPLGYAAKEQSKIMIFLIACPFYFTRLSLSLHVVYVGRGTAE
jgi:hypothetical protein